MMQMRDAYMHINGIPNYWLQIERLLDPDQQKTSREQV